MELGLQLRAFRVFGPHVVDHHLLQPDRRSLAAAFFSGPSGMALIRSAAAFAAAVYRAMKLSPDPAKTGDASPNRNGRTKRVRIASFWFPRDFLPARCRR